MLFFDVLSVVWHIIRCLAEGRTHFKRMMVHEERKLNVLANGPSLQLYLDYINTDQKVVEECDFFAVNDFITDDRCLMIKPRYYVLSDPMFLYITKYKERGLRVMNSLAERVNWDMTLFIKFDSKDSPFLPLLADNRHIKIEYYHSHTYPIFSELNGLRRRLFKHGLGNGEYSTVALNAIYLGITLGYKEIYLHGVDHTFFNGLMVNEENIPCYVYKHSFDTNEVIKPMVWHYDESRKYKDMPYFLFEMYRIFKGHWIMEDYANSVGTKIINCTEGSLIDAYPRYKIQKE